MNADPGKRLTRLVYAYTAVCVIGAVGVFLGVAAWHFALFRPSPDGFELRGDGPPHGLIEPGPPPGMPGHPPGALRPPPRGPTGPTPPRPVLLAVAGILLVLVAGASYAFAQRLTGPLRALEHAARRYGDGDLSARVNLASDDEFGAVGRAFDDMAARTARLIEAQNELMANVSHELRTPLARVRVALDILQECPEMASPAALAAIDEDVAELERMSSDVLASLRLAMTTGLDRLNEVDMADILDGLADRFRRNHPDRTLDLEVEPRPLLCRAEPQLIERAIDNLISNACKYSEATITVRAVRRGDILSISVVDRGIGMAAADVPRAFEPFFRSDRSRHKGTGGVGLGLNLVQRIVQAHDGTVRIESELDRGTQVVVELPQRRA
ncbi:MAG: HAMP domain-containing protein [Sandaracinaceae bacterium]|nr:HAMP domain-containing protein [Sandaracinaceae bacterium]